MTQAATNSNTFEVSPPPPFSLDLRALSLPFANVITIVLALINLLLTQGASEFTPVVVGRNLVLEGLHHTEVLVKKWSPPIGNQYYRSILPDVSITICSTCNKASANI
jgi:hypothetical protein